jgi:predicted TIM-barrel fold metal-dependent hydrolase
MDHFWLKDPGAASKIKKLPSEYVAQAFTFSTQPLDETDTSGELTALLESPALQETLLFSSDYPHYDADSPDFILRRIPEQMRPAVCFENALRVFGPKIFRGSAFRP